jgi:hypothetical protein
MCIRDRFLNENVKLVYDHLPDWMKGIWKDVIRNEHEIGFGNGSMIRSLTSSADTLRSNASFLNIIDEAAFMPDMEAMWAGGWSTLQHGGSTIVISTPNGVGNWYWDKWTDAEAAGLFNPILIHWWDMDWVIEALDPISGKNVRIAPTDNIRKCTTKEEINKWGPYYSPWLEQEFRGLQARGESHLFKQEILAEFIGSGGTILDAAAIHNVGKMIEEAPETQSIADPVNWVNQATGDSELLDFEGSEPQEGLWIWHEPVVGKPARYSGGKIVSQGTPGHAYVIGVDIATGENNDYSGIEIFDINEMEQVAEYMGRVPIPLLAKMVDWLGRWYNDALINPERTGIGIPFIQNLRELIYPNIWRKKKKRNLKPGSKSRVSSGGITYEKYGFATTASSKPTLNTALIDYISGVEGEGYTINSPRLYRELLIYIRHRNKMGIESHKTGAQEGRGNHDDLVMASAMAFIAIPDAVGMDPMGLLPTHSKRPTGPISTAVKQLTPVDRMKQQNNLMSTTDHSVIIPLTYNNMNRQQPSQQDQLAAFTNQLTNSPRNVPIVKAPKTNLLTKKSPIMKPPIRIVLKK